MNKLIKILLLTFLIIFSFNIFIMAQSTTSVGVRVLNFIGESDVLYGPMGSVKVTDNFKVRGSYLFGTGEGRMGVEALYLFDIDAQYDQFYPYAGGGISQLRVKNFGNLVAGGEIGLTENIEIFGEAVYTVPISHRNESESSFNISTGIGYIF